MKYIAPLLSGIVIGFILVGIAFSTTNTVLLIADKQKDWSSPTEYLPEIKVPDVIANKIVTTVEARLTD